MQKTKNILILVAHPSVDNSFSHWMATTAEETLKQKKYAVKVVDLYKIKFNPAGGPDDFTKISNEECFDYQVEQKFAVQNNTFTKEVQEQIDLVKWADTIIYSFPIYWYSVPAILKGWCDKIFAYYFSYGGGHDLKGKQWQTLITTGGPKPYYSAEGKMGKSVEDLLWHFNVSTPNLMNMEILPMFVAYSVKFIQNEDKQKIIEDLKVHLNKYI